MGVRPCVTGNSKCLRDAPFGLIAPTAYLLASRAAAPNPAAYPQTTNSTHKKTARICIRAVLSYLNLFFKD